MPTLNWSNDMALDVPLMDDDHQAIVQLLAAAEAANNTALIPAWQRLVEYTAKHFAMEDQWMADTGFASDNCHSSQHKIVLDIMKEGAVKGALGDLGMVRQMTRELAGWLPMHVDAMDSVLVNHLRSVGYDPVTRTVNTPAAMPTQQLHSCGSDNACAPASADKAHTTAETTG